MKKRSGSYPPVRVEGGGRGVVSQAGAVLLVETARKTGLDAAISAGDEGGEAACLLHRICPACGAVPDGVAPAYCSRCGEQLSTG